MAIKLNRTAAAYAEKVITAGEFEKHLGNWKEDEPTQDEIAKFLQTHTIDEYALWFLGMDTSIDQKNIEAYTYPYGDLKVAYKEALLLSQKEAVEKGDKEIERAAAKLIDMIDKHKD